LSSTFTSSNAQEDDHRQVLIEQLQLLGEIASTETALFQQRAAMQYGLGITDMKTLSILLREGPMAAGEIGSRLGLTSGSVTTLIDRLEQQNLVSRQPHTKDRRKVIVIVNQEKLATGDNVYHSMGEAFSKLLETYTIKQLEFLVQFYQATIEVTRQEIAKLAT
jgi:MarR family transcriptional regulator, organic hydroperoxide resistance regulator